VVVGQILSGLSWQVAVHALVSPLIVRPIAAALSLIGSGVAPSTTAIIG
jgi:hypothetical protein